MNEIYITYENFRDKENEIKLINNKLVKSIDCFPNSQAVVDIRGNTATNPIGGIINLNLTYATQDILQNIKDKTGIKYFSRVNDMIFPKNEYVIYRDSIGEIYLGRKAIFEAGSTLSFEMEKILLVNGELELNGTTEERIKLKGLTSSKWKSIETGTNSKIKIINADVENGGGYYNGYSYPMGTDWLKNRGDLEIENVNVTGTVSAVNGINSGFGRVSIKNSNFDGKVLIFDTDKIDIENCKMSEIYIYYTSNKEANVKISNNVLSKSIEYKPRGQVNIEVKDNVIKDQYSYPVIVDLNNIDLASNPNFFKNIDNNQNINYERYNCIKISGNMNNVKLTGNNKYYFENLTVPENKILEIEAGAICRQKEACRMTVKGYLYINGTINNKVEYTSFYNNKEDYNSFASGIEISATGLAVINNLDMQCVRI